MSARVILVWFRNDLRTADNEVLLSAIEKSDFVIPVYISDPRYFQSNEYGFNKTGDHRKLFIEKSLINLKTKLQNLGGDLLYFNGFPEEIIPHLVQKYEVDEVYHHREVAQRETNISERVEEALWKLKINLKHFIGHTLYHKEDLPFPIKDIPNDFNTFKKKVNKESFVRPSLTDIQSITCPPHLEKTALLINSEDQENIIQYSEAYAFEVLEQILNENDLSGENFYKISPYLTHGIISPAQVYHYVIKHSNAKNKKVTQKLLDNLYLRDYYRFMLKKYPNCYFVSSKSKNIDTEKVDLWTQANTDNASINDLMTKLNQTGALTQSESETLAKYFVYDLQQHWLIGAAWFEQQLLDYAPATNYGFWAHMGNEGTSIKNNHTN